MNLVLGGWGYSG